MEERRESTEIFPNNTLVEAVEIIRQEETGGCSLQWKLQEELASPENEGLRDAASDLSRIGKLKAPEGLVAKDFMRAVR